MDRSQQQAVLEASPGNGAWEMLSTMLPTADWSAVARDGEIVPAVDGAEFPSPRPSPEGEGDDENPRIGESRGDVYDRLSRALSRRGQRHLLLTGLKGVGKTATVRELARRAAGGDIPLLKDRRFLWLDVSNVGPEDSRACLETIAAAAQTPPANTPDTPLEIPEGEQLDETIGRIFQRALEQTFDKETTENSAHSGNEVILVLDGLDALLKRPGGGTNKPLLRAIAARPGVQIIGLLDRWAFNDLIAGDAAMLELFSRVDLEEPHEDTALEILKQKAAEFAKDYDLTIEDDVIAKTISLASNYVMNECHPAKGIKILQQACDDVNYTRTQSSNNGELQESCSVTVADIIRVVSDLTGIPAATLQGDTGAADFEAMLAEAVLGQDRAVHAAATELRLIKSGLSEPGKPAGVLLFAGMTGVGKTELAKRIAELYSTSKRLQSYAMGNFTEPHSVSGIIGVPPGYVGHEDGGRLVNELNSDPYSVFLLDEAEKCHPNVWKPFLNLFDEGWLVDQRGTKAHADRAIFILTTNAGDKTIAQMSRQGKSDEEIIERVKATLSRVRQERSSQPVFTPQFLARLKRIVVFGPLDEEAMIGITRKLLNQVTDLWQQKRDRELVVEDDVIEALGKRAFALNEKSNGEEGGRVVRKLISDVIEHRIQVEATARREEYRNCRSIRVELESPGETDDSDAPVSNPVVSVHFEPHVNQT